ncbi:MAG: Holliday junction resolvase RuvX [Oscillospiraceae bacterium]|nr:Holliday junction resolvase RuvX [Oscillospiraceae bacterium]
MRIMAVDYGESRTGIAVCDPTEFLASPVCIIKEKNTLKAIEKIVEKAKELKAEQIVVGHPLNMDGSRGERAEKCTFVKEEVAKLSGIDTVLWDERATTKTALGMLSDSGTFGKKRKEVLDAVAATVILENYLAWRKNNR